MLDFNKPIILNGEHRREEMYKWKGRLIPGINMKVNHVEIRKTFSNGGQMLIMVFIDHIVMSMNSRTVLVNDELGQLNAAIEEARSKIG